jgi:hypothetical protein
MAMDLDELEMIEAQELASDMMTAALEQYRAAILRTVELSKGPRVTAEAAAKEFYLAVGGKANNGTAQSIAEYIGDLLCDVWDGRCALTAQALRDCFEEVEEEVDEAISKDQGDWSDLGEDYDRHDPLFDAADQAFAAWWKALAPQINNASPALIPAQVAPQFGVAA